MTLNAKLPVGTMLWVDDLNGWEARRGGVIVRVMRIDTDRYFTYAQSESDEIGALWPDIARTTKLAVTDKGEALMMAAKLMRRYHGGGI